MMKILLSTIMCIILGGSSLYSQNFRDIKWTSYLPTDTLVLEFKSNDTLVISNSDTSIAISVYSVSQDTVFVTDFASVTQCSLSDTGVYVVSISNDTLSLDSINDPCSIRVGTLDKSTWFRTSLGIGEFIEMPIVSVYPNPMIDEAVLQIEALGNLPYSMNMYDIMGKLVRSYRDVNTTHLRIQRNGLPSGIYSYQLFTADGAKVAGKLLLK